MASCIGMDSRQRGWVGRSLGRGRFVDTGGVSVHVDAASFRGMTLWSVVLIVGGLAALVYGSLDLFAPATTTRWQVRSTARAGKLNKAVGRGFQHALKIDPEGEAWTEPSVLPRVRLIGAVLALIGAALVGLGAALWQ